MKTFAILNSKRRMLRMKRKNFKRRLRMSSSTRYQMNALKFRRINEYDY